MTARRYIRWGLAGLALILQGCASMAWEYQQQGFWYMQQSFNTLPADPKIDKTIILKEVKIHIVSDCSRYGLDTFRDPEKGVVGYATSDNEIWVLGRRVNGKIVVNQAVLGHELAHLLSYRDFWELISPDLYEPLFKSSR